MKVIYAREGGLFPQVSEKEIDVEDLPADLQTLARSVFENPDSYRPNAPNPNLRDGYQYRIEFREGRKKASLTFDDLNLPDVFQPLLQFLQKS
jgi:hypothetical protein